MRRAALISLIVAMTGCATSPPSIDPQRLLIVTVANSGSEGMPSRGYHQPGYHISDTAAATLAGLQSDYHLTSVDGWPIASLGVYCAVMAVGQDDGRDATLARVKADPRVHLAQPMQLFSVHGGYDDPYFDQQYGAGSEQLLQMHQRATGRGVRIAMIDTGVDRAHPDLKGRIGVARNFVTHDAHFDSDIHGTAVAGIIAADANNATGIVGIAPRAELLVLRACWQIARDDIRAQCNTFTLAKALAFAIDQRADIINMSLGGPNDPLLALLVEVALARDIAVVAARDSPDDFPASVAGVIAVRDSEAARSTADRSVVEVAASDLLSTRPGARYDYYSGSSMGAARVAGLAALLLEEELREEDAHASPADRLRNLNQRIAALDNATSDRRVVRSEPAAAPIAVPHDQPRTELVRGG